MRTLFAIVLSAFLLFPSTARAWGATGHRVVAAIAWSRLSPQARRDLRELAPRGRRGFSERALWADEVRGTEAYGWSGPLHYLNVTRGDTEVGRPEACDAPGPGCVMSAIERYEAVLADEDATVDARAEAVAFLLHFVGDIHQPLHCGYADDRGGNDTHLNFSGAPTNLHRIWDDQLMDARAERWRPMTRRLLRGISSAQAQRWLEAETPAMWAQESLDLLRSGLYPEGIEVGDAYVDRFYPDVERRLSMAGVRLAAVLERALARARDAEPS